MWMQISFEAECEVAGIYPQKSELVRRVDQLVLRVSGFFSEGNDNIDYFSFEARAGVVGLVSDVNLHLAPDSLVFETDLDCLGL